MPLVNSAFWLKLQGDNVEIVELLDLEMINGVSFHWTTGNDYIFYTLSGALTRYEPFPGKGGADFQEGIDLSVQAMNFTIANSGNIIQGQLLSQDFAQAQLKIGQVFIDTPDLDRMPIYNGKMGDFGWNRQEMTGQARNLWKSLNIQWPYYTYTDNCTWKFGSTGCGVVVASQTIAVTSINVGSSTQIAILVASGMITQSYANNRFDFGRMTVTYGTNSGTIRTIMTQTGDFLQLAQPLPNSDLTSCQISIYPGCKKGLIADCKSLYNNDKFFQGRPWMVKMADAY